MQRILINRARHTVLAEGLALAELIRLKHRGLQIYLVLLTEMFVIVLLPCRELVIVSLNLVLHVTVLLRSAST